MKEKILLRKYLTNDSVGEGSSSSCKKVFEPRVDVGSIS
jgi:hypothetical protein